MCVWALGGRRQRVKKKEEEEQKMSQGERKEKKPGERKQFKVNLELMVVKSQRYHQGYFHLN